jgi:hypothetical protein
MGTQANSQPNGSAGLNVIFHGACTFDQSREDDRILMSMAMMDHHVYRAGNWLAETELRGRKESDTDAAVYELVGVKAGTARFKPELKQNLIVKTRREDRSRVTPYATLRLPLPRTITSLRVAEIPRAAFTHPEELLTDGDPQHIATLQVFTYDVQDQNALSLQAHAGGGHFWEPVLMGHYINLHIFAAEDHFHKPSNAEEDFNESARLLGGVKLRLQTGSLRANGILDVVGLPDGMAVEETETLALRTQRMARLGRIVKRNGDTNLAWYGNDALDGSDDACAPPIGS